MEEIKDQNIISQYTKEKQALEVGLGMDMLEIFNDRKAGLIYQIRKLVKAGIRDMDSKRNAKLANQTIFDQNWNAPKDKGGWKNYAGCTANKINAWNADDIINNKVDSFKAEHCADWIRIYGEVIEKVIKGDENLKRESYQKGDNYHWSKYDGKAGGEQIDKGRRRLMATFNPNSAQYAQRQTEAWNLLTSLPDAGIKRWNIMEKDTTGKMDQVFGLTPGATISGTTTDNIYFIKKFSRLRLDPIYFLLPLAAIVAGGHHTLLEVALPLSLNGLVQYEIGFYSTLFPKRGALPEQPDGIREIKLLLGNYEKHKYNHLMLTYYSGIAQPAGCFLYNRISEEKSWKKFAKADEILMNKFKTLLPWPKRLDALKLCY